MSILYHTLISSLSLIIVTRVATTSPECSSIEDNNFTFLMSSLRNRTGQWIAKVELRHGTDDIHGSWDVEVDHSTEKCGTNEVVTIATTIVGPKTRLASGYELMPGFGYYKFYVTGKSWRVAKETCEEEVAHLVIINSMEEFVAIKKIWDRHPSPYTDWRKNHVYTGVTDIAKEGHFVTILGGTLNSTGYEIWGPNQPDGGVKEDCLLLTVNTHIHDVACHAEVSFICERELLDENYSNVSCYFLQIFMLIIHSMS